MVEKVPTLTARHPVPVLAKGETGRLWSYVRRPAVRRARSAGSRLPLFARRADEHPERHLASYAGLMQADACQ
jgi:transposase